MDASAQLAFSFLVNFCSRNGAAHTLGGEGGGRSSHLHERSLQTSSQTCPEACLLGELDLSSWPY